MSTLKQLFSRAVSKDADLGSRMVPTRELRSNSYIRNNGCDEDDDEDDEEVKIIKDVQPNSEVQSKHSRNTDKNTTPKQNLSKPSYELTPPQSRTIRRRLVPPSEVMKTPNLPRVKGSLFNRKFKEITSSRQMTPDSDDFQATTPMINRRRSFVYGSPRVTALNNGSTSARSNKRKLRHNEPIASDYSTPRTTRYFVKSINSNSNNKSKNVKVAYLVYQPLQLDNESSSESSDCFLKRRVVVKPSSPDTRAIAPLAIEGPPNEESFKITEVTEQS